MRWIDINDWVPSSPGEYVLVCGKIENHIPFMMTGFFEDGIFYPDFDHEAWVSNGYIITHWTLLPPYPLEYTKINP